VKRSKIRKSSLLLILILSFGFNPFLYSVETKGNNHEPFFNIALLISGSVGERVACASLMIDELAKIGIGVYEFDTDLSGDLVDRTWWHTPPIPTYENGGFDIVFASWGNNIDVDLSGRYHSSEITTDGLNFYQYNKPLMDSILENYSQAFLPNDRVYWAGELQEQLYEDLPAISILYEAWMYPHNENLTGFNGTLWAEEKRNIGDWSISGQDELRYALLYFPNAYHIYRTYPEDRIWLNQIYTSMIERTPENRSYGPKIALSWNTTNGLRYDIQLDPNAKWADGHVLNASDVKFSFEVISSPDFNSPDESFWMQYIDSDSITIIDEFNVEIEFLEAYTFHETNLALPLIPKHIWWDVPIENQSAQAIEWIESDPSKIIGAGPFVLHSYNKTEGFVHLKRNPYYQDLFYAEDPAFEDVYFIDYDYYNKAEIISDLQSGFIDIVEAHLDLSLEDIDFPGVTYEQANGLGLVFEMAFNLNHPYFGTGSACPINGSASAKNMRKAISHIIPRNSCLELSNGLGYPGVTTFPVIGFGYNTSMKPSKYDLVLAKQYMEAAGFEYPEIPTTSLSSVSIIVLIALLSLIGGVLRVIRKKEPS
jgi:ABC-type transport system substrate-binding protein